MADQRIVYLKPTWLAAVKCCGTYSQTVPLAWSKVFEWLSRGMHHKMPGRGFGLTYDDPRNVPAEDLRYLAGVEVPSTWRPCDTKLVSRYCFEGGSYTLRRHQGPYPEMEQVIAKYRDGWSPRHGLNLDASRPILTVYRSDIRAVEPKYHIADICLPIIDETGGAE